MLDIRQQLHSLQQSFGVLQRLLSGFMPNWWYIGSSKWHLHCLRFDLSLLQ